MEGAGAAEAGGALYYTTDDALSHVGFGRYQALVLAYAAVGWVAEAMEIMLLSFIGPAVEAEWGISGQQEGLITSVVFAGMIIGACLGGFISDGYGRRTGFLFTAVVTGIFGLSSAFAPNYTCLLCLRFVVGMGLGAGHVLATWFLEFVPASKRGTWVAVFHGTWTVGTIFQALIAWLTSELSNGERRCAHVEIHVMQKNNDRLYRDVLVTSSAEFPGLVLAALLVDRVGRKVSMGAMVLLCCVFIAPLAVPLGEGLATTLLFSARALIMGAFAVLYIYAPEIYPTSSRNTGVGIATSLGRIGGMVSPLIAVGLLENCHQKEAVFVFVLVLFLAAVACALFPLETKGRQIQ